MPETVASFTPLVYALRYTSKEVIDFLISQGALLGKAKKQVIKDWVLENNKITEEELEKRFKQLKQKHVHG